MSDDYSHDVYGDTDPNNVPDGGADQDTSAGDGLPGFPVDGYPGLRAGVFGSGRGLLGMARVSDLLARPGNGAPAMVKLNASEGPQDGARLTKASWDPVLDQEQNSWRWNDPNAIAYDIDRKERQKAQAEAMAGAVEAFGDASEFLPPLPKGAGFATGLAGGYMGHVEAERIQKEIDALKARQDQLRGPRGT